MHSNQNTRVTDDFSCMLEDNFCSARCNGHRQQRCWAALAPAGYCCVVLESKVLQRVLQHAQKVPALKEMMTGGSC